MRTQTNCHVARVAGLAAILTGMLMAQSGDADFVRKASEGGMAEVKLGQLAQQKASHHSVKEFGRRMEADHSKAGDELKGIAAEQGMTVESALNSKDQALYDRLSGLSGDEFDRAYINAMVRDHREDISEFQKEASTGRNEKVKAFASKTLPTLREHLKLAEAAANEVGITRTGH